MPYRKYLPLLFLLSFVVAFLAGCSTAQEELETAEQALEEAQAMGAESIATEDYRKAQACFVQAMDEMRAGNETKAKALAKESKLCTIDAMYRVTKYNSEMEAEAETLER